MDAHLINSTVQFIATVKNRDAVLRLIQFTHRVFLNVLANTNKGKMLTTALTTSTAALVAGRKLFAFGNEISEMVNTTKLLNAAMKVPMAPETVLPVVRSVAMTNFWLFDHIQFLAAHAKVLKADVHWHVVTASRVWLIAILCSIILDGKTYAAAIKASVDESKSPDDKLVERAKAKAAVVRQARNVCDLVVSVANSEIAKIHPLIVNFCGAVSAAIFCYENWPVA